MRISTKIRATLLFVGSIAFSNAGFAQDEIGELIKSTPFDVTALTKAYMEPLFKGFGLGLNSGWTNTASVKKLGRFEIRVSGTGAFIPSSDKSFDLSKIGLFSNIRVNGQPVSSQNNIITPTVAGSDETSQEVAFYNNNKEVTKFSLPKGINVPIIPAPQLQASIGLIKGIEVTARYMPEIKPGGDYGTLSMLGGGIKFQPLRLVSKTAAKLIPFDFAIALGYSQFKYAYDLDVQPESTWSAKDNQQSKDFSNQRFDIKFSGINAEAIISKKLLFFTPFASVGYMTSETKGGLLGNYAVLTDEGSKYTTYHNPVNLDEKYIKSLRASAGFQLNLAFLRFYASYSLATYNYVNAGTGLGIGK